MTEDQAISLSILSLLLGTLSPGKGKECVYGWVLGKGQGVLLN